MESTKAIERLTEAKLKFHINGYWGTNDFIKLLDSTTRLHNYYYMVYTRSNRFKSSADDLNWHEGLLRLPEFGNFIYNLKRDADLIFNSPIVEDNYSIYKSLGQFENTNLKVSQIKFSSPGNIDLLGIGKAFESIKEVLFHYFPNSETQKNIELKQAEIEIKQTEREIKEQEVLSKKIENFKKMGFTQIDIQKLIGLEYNHVEKLISMKNKNQIINIELIDEK